MPSNPLDPNLGYLYRVRLHNRLTKQLERYCDISGKFPDEIISDALNEYLKAKNIEEYGKVSHDLDIFDRLKSSQERERRKQQLIELACTYDTSPDEFSAICKSDGFTSEEILAEYGRGNKENARTQRHECRGFIKGILAHLGKVGLATESILAHGYRAGYSEHQIRRSLADCAKCHKDQFGHYRWSVVD